jgi:hypothetical protein
VQIFLVWQSTNLGEQQKEHFPQAQGQFWCY